MKFQFFLLLLAITIFSTPTKAQEDITEDATSILKRAITQAKADNKKVLLKYSASWCGWCKVMDRRMKGEECKAFFEDNYITITLDALELKNTKHLETPGANELLKKHKGDKAGLPFWLIIDENGNILEDSFNEQGQNLGCPSSEEEVRYFISVLKNTSKLNQKALNIISETFRSKKYD